MLLGNHEWMMMKALGISYLEPENEGTGNRAIYEAVEQKRIDRSDKEESLGLWYDNGGEVTHQAWNGLSGKEQKKLGDFLCSLPLSYDVNINGKDFKLVHAAPAELYRKFSASPYSNKAEFAVWDRGMFYYKFDIGSTVIFGHTATCYMQDNNPLEVWDMGDLVGIDCGSGIQEVSGLYPVEGRLACLRLDDRKVFYSK